MCNEELRPDSRGLRWFMLRMSRFAAPCSHPHPYMWGTPAGLGKVNVRCAIERRGLSRTLRSGQNQEERYLKTRSFYGRSRLPLSAALSMIEPVDLQTGLTLRLLERSSYHATEAGIS
jgi:hypothetical protein